MHPTLEVGASIFFGRCIKFFEVDQQIFEVGTSTFFKSVHPKFQVGASKKRGGQTYRGCAEGGEGLVAEKIVRSIAETTTHRYPTLVRCLDEFAIHIKDRARHRAGEGN